MVYSNRRYDEMKFMMEQYGVHVEINSI